MAHIPAAERRDALVQAALRVVAEGGVGAATTRAIAAEAGMPLASFHYVFDSRDDLMAHLVTFVVGQEEAAILPEPIVGSDLQEVISAGLWRYADLLRADPLREQAMLELTHYALRSADMADLARRQYEHYFSLAASALTSAATHLGLVWDRPVDEVARILVALTDGMTISWLVDRDDAALSDIISFAAESVARFARTPERAHRDEDDVTRTT
ncbi:TetR/AcrR family transcriptional regulator [Glaciibacter superstes]|uniref:TetR/AcrR family transcriptional regulator n=1 Tax=Glaciibacter superstes TaxID=501023 RepID=UPI0003B422EC|nr:TetR family transcriptional regulator [Glaciibacter superstes]